MKTQEEPKTFEEQVMKRLEGLVVYLANLNNNDDNVMMSAEDIISELNEEIIKGLKYYAKENKTVDDVVNLLKRMCYNRIGELRYRYYLTYRRHEKTSISLEVNLTFDISTDEGNPEKLFDSSVRVSRTLEMLNTKEARLIFKKIIVEKQFASADTDSVYNHMCVEDIARITGLTPREASIGIREIKSVYAEVVNNDNN
jgi:hypothetical protein